MPAITPGVFKAKAPMLQGLNHRHQQIINWLIANPHRGLGECAKDFGYSQTWISQVIHSDAFQALYQARCQQLGVAVVHTIKDEITNTAAMAMAAIRKRIETGVASEKLLLGTTKTVLDTLGYTRGAAPQVQVNAAAPVQVTVVDKAALINARERAASARQLLAGREGEYVAPPLGGLQIDLAPARA